ncbi:MAG TPA: flagellar motor switch protein FliN [Bryobacteraceae bacterium]
MNPTETASRLDRVSEIHALVDSWAENLGEVLEFLTAERPQVSWQTLGTTPANAAELLWWKQGFSVSPEAAVWIGAPQPSWEAVANLMIKAAGLEASAEGESRKNWEEVLSQWLSTLARSIGSALGQEVLGTKESEAAPPEDQKDWAALTLTFAETPLAPLAFAFSTGLLDLLAAASTRARDTGNDASPPSEEATPVSRTMELLLDVELPVSISFGRTELPLKDVLKLTTGSIVELNRGVDDPVEILVNHCLVARGQVVVVDGNYGVRIQQIIDRQERLRTLR